MNKQQPKASEARKRKDPPTSGNSDSNANRSSNKNASHSGQQNNARSQKRAKLMDARTIRTQPSGAALKDGDLDLQAFLSAREFEIRALEAGMRKSKAASTTRAFQKVPRAMRRRTASHNVKRVPKRLRARAAREMADDNTPTVAARKRRPRTTRARIRAEMAKKLRMLSDRKKRRRAKEAAGAEGEEGGAVADVSTKPTVHTRQARPKIRRNVPNEPPKPKSKFRKRQINKTWLPTHLWHAKRARMTGPKDPLWRFAIPLTPNEKCYRPTHRASGDKGAVVWDMSYMSTIGVYGSAEGIARVFMALGLPQHLFTDRNHQRWRSGLRKQSGMLSKERKGVRRDIGPATIIWNPEKGPEAAEEHAKAPRKAQRQVLIRVHPSCFFELFNELTKLVKAQTPQLYVEDLRFEIGSIELTGPASTEALLSILHPYHTKGETEEQHAKVFRSLVEVTNPASLPPGALLAFSIMDPRLRHPPKRVQAKSEGDSIAAILAEWPVSDNPKPYGLFDRDARFQAGVLPSQKSLDRRKGSGTPGMELGITAADPAIPIILFALRPSSGGQAQGSWTLMAPWKCILPIWYNLVKVPLSTGGNPRFGGLDELRQVAFEQGVPWFPGDYPGTDAGAEWELEQRAKRKADWDRRPKGKRVAWDTLDLGAGRKGEVADGFACDFESLFGLPKDDAELKKVEDEEIIASGDSMEVEAAKDATNARAKEKGRQQVSRDSLAQIHRISRPTFSALHNRDKPQPLPTSPPHLIITVSLTFVGRGVANPCARVYRLPTHNPVLVVPSTQAEVPATPSQPGATSGRSSLPSDLREQWLSRLGSSKSRTHARNGPPAPPPPPPRRIPADADMATRKRLVAESILNPVGGPLPFPWETAQTKGNKASIGGQHPLCPGEEDLMGFVTTGSFCLAGGKGKAVGSLAVSKALEAIAFAQEKGAASEGRLCVVRNAGESVGWLARWEVV